MIELIGVNIPVRDLDRAVAFYSQLLSSEPVSRSEHYVLFESSGSLLGLLAVDPASAQAAVPQPLLRSADLDGAMSLLGDLSDGMSPIEVHDGHRLTVLPDPDGNLIEVYEG